MAFEDVTPEYVNAFSSDMYVTRTADDVEFNFLKEVYSAYINPARWPSNKVTLGLTLLILHHYAVDTTSVPDAGDDTSGQKGALLSEREGDIAFTYANPGISAGGTSGGAMGGDAWLSKSQWGQQYAALFKTFKASAGVC